MTEHDRLPAHLRYDDRTRLASYRRTAPRPPASQAGAWVVIIVGLCVVVAEWALYPQSIQGQQDANWALGFMILSTAGALRILYGNPGHHLAAAAVIIACGIGMLLRALLVGDSLTGLDGFEIGCGVLWLLGGVATLVSPMLSVERPRPSSWG